MTEYLKIAPVSSSLRRKPQSNPMPHCYWPGSARAAKTDAAKWMPAFAGMTEYLKIAPASFGGMTEDLKIAPASFGGMTEYLKIAPASFGGMTEYLKIAPVSFAGMTDYLKIAPASFGGMTEDLKIAPVSFADMTEYLQVAWISSSLRRKPQSIPMPALLLAGLRPGPYSARIGTDAAVRLVGDYRNNE